MAIAGNRNGSKGPYNTVQQARILASPASVAVWLQSKGLSPLLAPVPGNDNKGY